MPQPLSRVFLDAKITVTPSALTRFPELAALVMHVISIWSHIEGDLAGVLSVMLKTDIRTGTGMYVALDGRRQRATTLEAAAKAALNDDEYNLVKRVMKAISSSVRQRDQFAHQVWAFSEDLKEDALLLLQPKLITEINVGVRQAIVDGMKQLDTGDGSVRYVIPYIPMPKIDNNQVMVYRKVDLQREVRRANKSETMVRLLWGTLGHWLHGGDSRSELENLLG